MGSGMLQCFFEVLLKDIDGACDKSGLGSDSKRNRIERAVERAKRCGLCFLANLRCWRILALRQAVDAVVEEQNFQPHIAPQHVNRVIAADGKRIAITGRDPNFQVGSNRLNSRSDGGRAPVNGMKAKRVHVIREAARAADAGDHDEILALDAEVGKHRLYGGKDRVVPATGAPANFLVSLEVFLGERRDRWQCSGAHREFSPRISSIFCSTSACLNGRPCILLRPMASTRYLARSTQRSWPMFSSGTRTVL